MNTGYESQHILLSEKLIRIIRDNLNNEGSFSVLKKLDNIIQWKEITEIVTKSFPEASGGTYRNNKVITLIKCLLLENIFNFSDYKLFVELAEKDSFQNFVGIDSHNNIPKIKTISSFRINLILNSLYEIMFKKFNEQLINGNIEMLDDSIRDVEKKPKIINENVDKKNGEADYNSRDKLHHQMINSFFVSLDNKDKKTELKLEEYNTESNKCFTIN